MFLMILLLHLTAYFRGLMKILFTFLLVLLNMSLWAQATGKTLNVKPLMPSFLRSGDHIECAVLITNNTDKEQTGQVQLELTDSLHTSIDGWFMNTFPNQYVTIGARQSEVKRFPVQVPYNFEPNYTNWKFTGRVDSLPETQTGLLHIIKNNEVAGNAPFASLIQRKYFRFDRNSAKWISITDPLFHLGDSIKVRLVLKSLKNSSALEIGYPACMAPADNHLHQIMINAVSTAVSDSDGSIRIALPAVKSNVYLVDVFTGISQLGTFSSGPVYRIEQKTSKRIQIASGVTFSVEE